MKKTIKWILIFCACCFIFPGCTNDTPKKALCRVVTGVDITCKKEDLLIRRHYTDTKKMEAVLLYLRLLDPQGIPDSDPQTSKKDIYRITLHLSDGNQKVYRQTAHRYFSANNGSWKCIDPKKAAGLYTLMRKLPDDGCA